MKRLLVVLALAGCAAPNVQSPEVVARSPGNVVLVAGAASHIQETLTLATQECARMDGRTAVQRSALLMGDPHGGQVRFTFECVREAS